MNGGVNQLSKQLHPKVKEFKDFMNKHPNLIANIRKSGKPWQYYYEKWILNGENDPLWRSYTKTDHQREKQSKFFDQLMRFTKNIDMNKVQEHVNQLDQTIHTIQEMLNQFLETQNDQQQNTTTNQFDWFRD